MAIRRGRRGPTLSPLPAICVPPEARLHNKSAMPASWTDPDDTSPSAARTARVISGYRHFDPLRRCRTRHGERCGITLEHVTAADLLRHWADGAAIGFSTPRDLSLPVTAIQFRPSSGPGIKAQRQTRCWRQFVRVMAIFTKEQRQLMTGVVLLNQSVSAWCAERRAARARRIQGHAVKTDRKDAHGTQLLGGKRLAMHRSEPTEAHHRAFRIQAAARELPPGGRHRSGPTGAPKRAFERGKAS